MKMLRLLMKAILPIAAALVLDRYCKFRARRKKKEKATDVTRWEGEGGSLAQATPPA